MYNHTNTEVYCNTGQVIIKFSDSIIKKPGQGWSVSESRQTF